jgi:hypothetical protein
MATGGYRDRCPADLGRARTFDAIEPYAFFAAFLAAFFAGAFLAAFFAGAFFAAARAMMICPRLSLSGAFESFEQVNYEEKQFGC